MCNIGSEIAAIIRQVITEKVDSDIMFTAFDVSREVQIRLQAAGLSFVRHSNMKEVVHEEMQGYMQQGVYQRQLVDVGAPVQAFVYYPAGADPLQYVSGNIVHISAPAIVPVPAVTDSTDDGNQGRSPDARGTLAVPAVLVRAAGMMPGDKCYVYADTDKTGTPFLIITGMATGKSLAEYTVDAYNNVRITQKQLDAGGLTEDSFYFESDGSSVIVKAL
jgi:hypothetical protein